MHKWKLEQRYRIDLLSWKLNNPYSLVAMLRGNFLDPLLHYFIFKIFDLVILEILAIKFSNYFMQFSVLFCFIFKIHFKCTNYLNTVSVASTVAVVEYTHKFNEKTEIMTLFVLTHFHSWYHLYKSILYLKYFVQFRGSLIFNLTYYYKEMCISK